ncbi:Mu transposase C-terminal domain-containing protein [[Kitasatospora] papulosa]|uniref:Mu transposase C-terminal domain-containing protein n=1 Tax=[Kitasatospora] papulosa TaxID=1464011 RepID=UPI0036D1DF3D
MGADVVDDVVGAGHCLAAGHCDCLRTRNGFQHPFRGVARVGGGQALFVAVFGHVSERAGPVDLAVGVVVAGDLGGAYTAGDRRACFFRLGAGEVGLEVREAAAGTDGCCCGSPGSIGGGADQGSTVSVVRGGLTQHAGELFAVGDCGSGGVFDVGAVDASEVARLAQSLRVECRALAYLHTVESAGYGVGPVVGFGEFVGALGPVGTTEVGVLGHGVGGLDEVVTFGDALDGVRVEPVQLGGLALVGPLDRVATGGVRGVGGRQAACGAIRIEVIDPDRSAGFRGDLGHAQTDERGESVTEFVNAVGLLDAAERHGRQRCGTAGSAGAGDGVQPHRGGDPVTGGRERLLECPRVDIFVGATGEDLGGDAGEAFAGPERGGVLALALGRPVFAVLVEGDVGPLLGVRLVECAAAGEAAFGDVELDLAHRLGRADTAVPQSVFDAIEVPAAVVGGDRGLAGRFGDVETVVVRLGLPVVGHRVLVGVDDVVELPPPCLLARGRSEGRRVARFAALDVAGLPVPAVADPARLVVRGSGAAVHGLGAVLQRDAGLKSGGLSGDTDWVRPVERTGRSSGAHDPRAATCSAPSSVRTSAHTRVRRHGVRWRTRNYIADWMHGRVGEKVNLRYLPHHDHRVELYDPQTGRHLGAAVMARQATREQTLSLKRARRREADRLRAQLKEAEKNRNTRYAAATRSAPPVPLDVMPEEEALEHLRALDGFNPTAEALPGLIQLPEPDAGWTLPLNPDTAPSPRPPAPPKDQL